MRRWFLYFPIAIFTFVVGSLLSPYKTADIRKGCIDDIQPVQERTFGSHDSDLSYYYGYWGGSGGNVIELREHYITDVELGRTFQYRVIIHTENRYENSYLLQVIDLGTNSNLRNYVYLGFSDDGWMGYYGYNSLDDYAGRHFTAGGSFSRYRIK
jgi:hypothetical protein